MPPQTPEQTAATPAATPAAPAALVKARVLTDCIHGPANAVATLDAATADDGVKAGILDITPEAVTYAESLAAPQ